MIIYIYISASPKVSEVPDMSYWLRYQFGIPKLAAGPNLQVSLTLRSRTAAGYSSKIALNPNRQGRHDQQA